VRLTSTPGAIPSFYCKEGQGLQGLIKRKDGGRGAFFGYFLGKQKVTK
jgi:hypothetical protein